MRALVAASAARGRRLTWWTRVPRRVLIPQWWRWTVDLGYAIAGATVAERCATLGSAWNEWPPRLDLTKSR